MHADRSHSWAQDEVERNQRIEDAQAIVGLSLSAVHYVDVDYRRHAVAPDVTGPRRVEDPTEWEAPTWKFDGFDSVDFGVELKLSGDRVFSCIWDPPGRQEGIGIRESSVGSALGPDASVAVWDVGRRSNWSGFLRREIRAVDLHYLPWDDSGAWWCPRISLNLHSGTVDLLLGDAQSDGTLGPSSNNIAVIFSPDAIPPWVDTPKGPEPAPGT